MTIFYYGCEFVYTAATVWAIISTLEVVARGTEQGSQMGWAKYISTMALAAMKVLNTYTDSGLFSNTMIWVSLLVISGVSKRALSLRFWRSWMIGNVIWSLVAIGDLFVQTAVTAIFFSGQKGHVLMAISAYRGGYLLVWTVLIAIYFKCWLPRAKEEIVLICSRRIIRIATPIMIFCLLYFPRVYAFGVTGREYRQWWVFVLGLVLFWAGTSVYCITQKEKNNVELLQIKCGLLEEQYRQIMQEKKTKNILLHDMKNHLLALSGLAEDGQMEKVQSYIKEMHFVLEQKGMKTETGHPFLDLVLDQKITQAQNAGINVKIEIGDLSGLVMSELEICALFSNLWDNAIEANEKLINPAERWITMICKRQHRLLVIRIMNPTLKNVLGGEIPETLKADKSMHGLGLRSVRQVVDSHGGILRVDGENGEFDVYICMCAFESC